jgi:hypothetical protein
MCVSKRNEKENQLKKKSQWGHWKKVEWFPSFGYALRKKKKNLNTKTREESNRTFLSDVIMSRILVPTLTPTFELLDLSA